ncbi:MAG: sigma-70 family RNA polymerase sigma factor [Acidimicrobiales bacterium]|nr:sigma-70 family RNA polymerase sigma factor [Acidimicrobiales bacterium]
MDTLAREEFAVFFDTAERRLRLALSGAFGMEAGHDAAAESLAWACQNWDCVREMSNPMGYLYRVGRTAALRAIGHDVRFVSTDIEMHPAQWELPNFEPNLAKFLAQLSERQRVAVWMVHGLGFTNNEVADLLECSRPTVGTHVRRGLAKLRQQLGVDHD